MSSSSLDLGSLSILVLVVVMSCCVATLLSWWWMMSISPPTYQYCSSCALQLGVLPHAQGVLTDGVVARPVQRLYGQAGTFQRLGMDSARPGMSLEVEHLETRPLSPVIGEEEEEVKERNCVDYGRESVQQHLSPASVEALARRNTGHSFPRGYRMSRRTLVFPSQSLPSMQEGGEEEKSSINTVVGADEEAGNSRSDKNTKQRQVRRSVSARKEKSKLALLRRQEDAGLTSQSEDERGRVEFGRRSRRNNIAATRAAVSLGCDNPGYVPTTSEAENSVPPGPPRYQNLPNMLP